MTKYIVTVKVTVLNREILIFLEPTFTPVVLNALVEDRDTFIQKEIEKIFPGLDHEIRLIESVELSERY